MRDPSDQSDGNHHQKVWEILPWYVNGTLEGHEHDFCGLPHSEMSELRRRGSAMPVHRHSSPQLRRGCEDAITGESCALNGAHRPCKHVRRPGALADSCSRVDRKNPVCFSETPSLFRWALAAQTAAIVLLTMAITWPASSLLHYSIRRCRTRVATQSRVECTLKWFLPTI